MTQKNQAIHINLPAWLSEHIQSYSQSTKLNKRMDFVIAASKKNIEMKTGGPFAAAIFEIGSGKLISLGLNLVESQRLSILHAEILAISLAQQALKTYNLDSNPEIKYELLTSTEPCAMCLGAIPWSGVQRVVTGASSSIAEAIGFDEGAKPGDWKKALEARKIEVITQIQQASAEQVLKQYSLAGGLIYNSNKEK